jgi:hypothetical protein
MCRVWCARPNLTPSRQQASRHRRPRIPAIPKDRAGDLREAGTAEIVPAPAVSIGEAMEVLPRAAHREAAGLDCSRGTEPIRR